MALKWSEMNAGERRVVETLIKGEPADTRWRFAEWGDLVDAVRAAYMRKHDLVESAPEDDPAAPFDKLVEKYADKGEAQAAFRKLRKTARRAPRPDDLFAYKLEADSDRIDTSGDDVPGKLCAVSAMPAEAGLRAKFLRALAIGDVELPAGAARIGDSSPFPAGIRLHGWLISDPLDLAWLEGEPNVGLPVMEFFSCVFDKPIMATRAHLSALSFIATRLVSLDASHATVSGSLTLRNSYIEVVNFDHATIKGALDAYGTTASPRTKTASLRALEARIDGAVVLNNLGKSTPSASQGDQQAAAEEEPVLSVQAEGIQVSGGFDCVSAQLRQLNLRAARIGGELQIGRLRAYEVNLTHASVGRGLLAQSVVIGAKDNADATAFRMDSAAIGGDTFFTDCDITGAMSIQSTSIQGSLIYDGAKISSTTMLNGMKLGGDLWIINDSKLGSSAEKPEDQRFALTLGRGVFAGAVHITQSVLAGGVDATELRALSIYINGGGVPNGAINLDNARIAGSVSFSEDTDRRAAETPARAEAFLASADGKSKAKREQFAHDLSEAFQLRIGQSLSMNDTVIEGTLFFRNVCFEAELAAVYARGARLLGGVSADAVDVGGQSRGDSGAGADVAKDLDEMQASARSSKTAKRASENTGSARSKRDADDADADGPLVFTVPGLVTKHGAVAFLGCEIGGRCDFSGARLKAAAQNYPAGSRSWRGISFWMRDCHVDGVLRISADKVASLDARQMKTLLATRDTPDDDRLPSFPIEGLVGIRNTVIDGNLELYGTHFVAVECDADNEKHTNCYLAIECVGVHIKHDLHFDDPPAPNPRPLPPASKIDGAALIRRCKIDGDVHIGRAKWVAKSERTTECGSSADCMPIALSFEDTEIGGDIRLRATDRAQRIGIVDFSGAKLRAFDDDGGKAWGARQSPEVTQGKDGWRMRAGVAMRLDGCKYERLDGQENRDSWLNRQWPAGTLRQDCWSAFNAEPHHAAVSALHAAGNHERAWGVARHAVWKDITSFAHFRRLLRMSARHWLAFVSILALVAAGGYITGTILGAAAPTSWALWAAIIFTVAITIGPWLLSLFYWALFGAGFSPFRTAVALVAVYLVGVFAADDLINDRVLVARGEIQSSARQTSMQAEAAAQTPADAEAAAADEAAAALPTQCYDNGWSYALDAMLVGINLGPEERCVLSEQPRIGETWLNSLSGAHDGNARAYASFLMIAYSILSTVALVLGTVIFTRYVRRER